MELNGESEERREREAADGHPLPSHQSVALIFFHKTVQYKNKAIFVFNFFKNLILTVLFSLQKI